MYDDEVEDDPHGGNDSDHPKKVWRSQKSADLFLVTMMNNMVGDAGKIILMT